MFSGPAESYPRLLGDIGGTNARFALQRTPHATISDICTLSCADHAGPLEAIHSYLRQIDTPAPRCAAIGVANPITGDFLKLTNNTWAFSVETLRKELQLEVLYFLNDFKALALSLPHLKGDDILQIGGGCAVEGAAIGVIGPGTGLGVSGLLRNLDGSAVAVEGEGGHVSLCPAADEEMAVTQHLIHTFGHVSAERVLSGPGLITLYQALGAVRGQMPRPLGSAEITQAAVRASDALCADTLAMFCALLGSVAGNLALTLGARGGVFIGGGIVPRIPDYLKSSPFRSRFEAKGRFTEWLEKIPTQLITAENPALKGAAAALDECFNRG
jgi:glucokinase